MPARRKFSITGSNIGASLHLFLQQFERRPKEIVFNEAETKSINRQHLYFDRKRYQKQLQAALPVSNYFSWCLDIMHQYEQMPDTERFLNLASPAQLREAMPRYMQPSTSVDRVTLQSRIRDRVEAQQLSLPFSY